MEAELHLVVADRVDRLLEVDLALVERDIELTHLERVTGRIGSVAWVASYAAAIVLLVEYPVSTQGMWAVCAALVVSAELAFLALRRRLRAV